jgi:GntR family transcriptional regulator
MSTDLLPANPPFRQIAADLRRRIRSGEWVPGAAIPSMPELAEHYHVSRQTIASALGVLASEGLIVTRQGARTVVAKAPTEYRRTSRARYGRARADGGRLTRELRHTIAFTGRAPAPAAIAAIFGVEEGTEMVHRRRVSVDSQGPVEVGGSWLSVEDVGGSEIETSRESLVVPIFLTAERVSGRRYTVALDHWTSGLPTPEEAAALRIREDTPVLRVVHTAMDAERRPIEVSTSVWPAHRVVVEDEYRVDEAEAPADPGEV